ncbi:MAG: hypothetical protein ACQCN3_05055 [Candidatus Bathyarchaeia archaeon]
MTENVPFHRRRRSLLAVLLAIVIVIVIVIGISLGPAIPPHPVNPGSEVTPPPDNTTSPSPATTYASHDNIAYSISIYKIPQQSVSLGQF